MEGEKRGDGGVVWVVGVLGMVGVVGVGKKDGMFTHPTILIIITLYPRNIVSISTIAIWKGVDSAVVIFNLVTQ